MSKTTIEQFCLFLVERYLKDKLSSQVKWTEIANRIERQSLTAAEERQVRDFIAKQRKTMLQDENYAKRKAETSNKATEQSIFRFALSLF